MSEILKKPETAKGPAQWFTGDVWLDVIAPYDGPQQARCNSVHFAPGARTTWHKHINGQLMHVTEGVGLTQVRGGEIVVMRPGDTLWCPAGVWHWHGAAPDRFLTYLAIWDGLRDGQNGPEIESADPVTDEEYNGRPSS